MGRIAAGLFSYLNWANKDDLSNEHSQIACNYDILSGNLAQHVVSFPANRSSQAGNYAALTQTVTNNNGFADAPYPFEFRLSDDYNGSTSGYHRLQVSVDGTVIWEGDAAGNNGIQNVALNLQAWLQGKTNAAITVCMYEAQGVSNYKVKVSWNLPAGDWVGGETEAFVGTSTYHPAMPGQDIPLIVMIYDGGYYGGSPTPWLPTPDYVRQGNIIAYSEVQAGHADGIIQYCLDKSEGSVQFPIIQDLYANWSWFLPNWTGA